MSAPPRPPPRRGALLPAPPGHQLQPPLPAPPATNSSLLSQLLAVGAIPKPSLGLCLGDYGLLLLLGGTDPALHRGELQAAVLDPDTLGMGLLALAVNSAPLVLPHSLVAQLNPAVVDTTFHETVLPSDAFNLLAQAMLPFCSAATPGLCEDGFFSGRCYFIDPPALSDYPTITLTLEGLQGTAALALGPTQWLSFVNKKGYCLAISPSSLTGTRVGTQALTGYYALLNYSLDSPSVAFAPSTNCTGAQYTLALVSGNKQRGPVGTAAKQKLVVRVLELGSGMPVAGVYVNFQIVQGAASLGHIMPAEMRFGFVEGADPDRCQLGSGHPCQCPLLRRVPKACGICDFIGHFHWTFGHDRRPLPLCSSSGRSSFRLPYFLGSGSKISEGFAIQGIPSLKRSRRVIFFI